MHSSRPVYRRSSIDTRFSAITRHLPAPIVINCRRHFVTGAVLPTELFLLEYSNLLPIIRVFERYQKLLSGLNSVRDVTTADPQQQVNPQLLKLTSNIK